MPLLVSHTKDHLIRGVGKGGSGGRMNPPPLFFGGGDKFLYITYIKCLGEISAKQTCLKKHI